MPKQQPAKPTTELAPDAQPSEPSVQLDEHRGLAARLLDLRKLVEEHRQLAIREHQELKTKVAHLDQHVANLEQQLNRGLEAIQKQQSELGGMLRDGGDQVRQAGTLARRMEDHVRALDELRETQADPHQVIKPLQTAVAHLKGDLLQLQQQVDHRFEQLPKARARPYEERSADEDPLVKQGAEIRKLKERIAALEKP